MPTDRPTWTDARIEALLHLWNVEGYSASEVAACLGGVTRSAVLGKLKRLGQLGNRQKPVGKPRTKAPSSIRPKVPVHPWKRSFTKSRKTPPATKPVAAPESLGISIYDLKPTMCHWPYGDPKEAGFGFCGHPAHGPYCGFHNRVAHSPG